MQRTLVKKVCVLHGVHPVTIMDKGRHAATADVRRFRRAVRDTDRRLVAAEIREMLL